MLPVIVISGINLRQGGGLTILHDCLQYLSNSKLSTQYRIIALIHKRNLLNFPNIEYIEFPKSAKNWLFRLYYEYFYFYKLSKRLRPYLWLSLHDISPRIQAERQAVYMHNPSIVNKIKFSDLRFDKKYVAFSLFYKYLYQINIHHNTYCIVQQNWFRNICSKLYQIPQNKFIVARPNKFTTQFKSDHNNALDKKCHTFFYPSLPRPFKNFETLCRAATILEKKSIKNIEIIITIDGSENAYSKNIYKLYKNCKILRFVGLQTKEEVFNLYSETDCLIFPSRLETWGLPVSEFLPYRKPMIIADEPYAHETSEGADYVAFYPTNNAQILADLMYDLIKGDYSKFERKSTSKITPPSAPGYEELFDILLK